MVRIPKIGFLIFTIASVLAGSAQARLGETPEECTARYGTFLGKLPARVSSNGGLMNLYEKLFVNPEGYKIRVLVRVEFHNGKAWYIRYSGHIKERERQDLMSRNLPEDSWSEPEVYKGKTFWISKKSPKCHAMQLRAGDNLVLEMMTDECAQALGEQRIAQTSEILGTAAAEVAKDSGTTGSPSASAPTADKSPPPATTAPSSGRGLEGF